MAAKTKKEDLETVRTVREAFMKALVATLEAAEKHATSDGKGDAETAAHYANAAAALMNNQLAHELVVGSEGLNRKP